MKKPEPKPITDCHENGGNNNKHKWVLDKSGEHTFCEKCGITLKYWNEIFKYKPRVK